MKWDASESSDPDSKLQQVDLRMLEMEGGNLQRNPSRAIKFV